MAHCFICSISSGGIGVLSKSFFPTSCFLELRLMEFFDMLHHHRNSCLDHFGKLSVVWLYHQIIPRWSIEHVFGDFLWCCHGTHPPLISNRFFCQLCYIDIIWMNEVLAFQTITQEFIWHFLLSYSLNIETPWIFNVQLPWNGQPKMEMKRFWICLIFSIDFSSNKMGNDFDIRKELFDLSLSNRSCLRMEHREYVRKNWLPCTRNGLLGSTSSLPQIKSFNRSVSWLSELIIYIY